MYHGLALGVLVPLLASLPLLVYARSWLALRCFNCSSFVACFFCIDYNVSKKVSFLSHKSLL